MTIIQVCKKGNPYLKKYYNNNPLDMVKAMDGILWDDDRIKLAFSLGNGTKKDFMRYMGDNKRFCAFYDLEAGAFI